MSTDKHNGTDNNNSKEPVDQKTDDSLDQECEEYDLGLLMTLGTNVSGNRSPARREAFDKVSENRKPKTNT